MGTSKFGVPSLCELAEQHEVICVYTQPARPQGRGLKPQDSPIKIRSQELGLKVSEPEKLNTQTEIESLKGLNPDVIVVASYGKLLKKEVLVLPRLGCINIHPSLLPRWRGAAPIQWPILAGDSHTGVTTMLMVEELDAGDILEQFEIPIHLADDAEILHDRLSEISRRLILSTLKGLENATLTPKKQDPTKVTYAAKLTKEMENLDLHLSAPEVFQRIQALNPWPGTSVWILGRNSEKLRLKIKGAKWRPDIQGSEGAKIFERSGMILLNCVAAETGSIELLKVQWDGKREVGMSEFLNGLGGKGISLPFDLVI